MTDDDDELFRAGTVKAGEKARITITVHGVVVNDENGVALHAHDGSISTIRTDGIIETQNPVVKRIAIYDALKVEEYQTTRHLKTVSHVIKFKGGGWFGYIQDAQGKVIETTSRGVLVTKDKDGLTQIYGTDSGMAAPDA